MKSLVFDLDDTLVVEVASADAAFLETCALAESRYGIQPPELHVTVKETCRDIWYNNSPERAYCVQIGISSWEALWAEFIGPDDRLEVLRNWSTHYRKTSWCNALQKFEIDDEPLALALADAFIKNRRKRHVVIEGALPLLQTLGESYRLGLLTNGTPDLQWRKIEGAGIRSYFEEIVISGEFGVAKPDERIYNETLSRLGASADSAMMIGNSLRADIEGAQGVGMKTVWVNRSGKAREDSVFPDYEVRDLRQLGELLEADRW
jgi:phosphoserine phosphatase